MRAFLLVVILSSFLLTGCERDTDRNSSIPGYILTADRDKILEINTISGTSRVLWQSDEMKYFGLASPSYSQQRSLIALEATQLKGLLLFNVKDKSPSVVIELGGPYLFPKWSNNGKSIAVQIRSTPLNQKASYLVKVLDTSGVILWTSQQESCGGAISWAKDDSALIFSDKNENLVYCDLKADSCRTLFPGSSPVLAADGASIAFIRGNDICTSSLSDAQFGRCFSTGWLTSPSYIAAWDKDNNCIVSAVKKISGFAERNFAYCYDVQDGNGHYLAELHSDMGFEWSRKPIGN